MVVLRGGERKGCEIVLLQIGLGGIVRGISDGYSMVIRGTGGVSDGCTTVMGMGLWGLGNDMLTALFTVGGCEIIVVWGSVYVIWLFYEGSVFLK